MSNGVDAPAARVGPPAALPQESRARSMIDAYLTLMRSAVIQQFQYRGANYFYMIGMVAEPVVYLVVWSSIARSQGGEVAGYTPGAFAAYYIVWTLVRNINIVFTPYGWEERIKQGELSGHLLRLAWLYFRVSVMNDLQYRVNFVIQLFQSILALGTGLVVLALVFSQTDELDGWSRPELLAIMGVFTLMGGVIRSFIQPSMQRLLEDVRQGTLDFTLTKPADAQVLVSVRDVRIWPAVDIVSGLVVLGVALAQLGERTGVGGALAFGAMVLLGAVMIYCFWLVITTGAFWLVRMDQVQELFQGVYRAGQYPVGIYPGWLRFGLTFLVPLAFAITVPAEAVTSRLDWGSVVLALVVVVVLVVGSRAFWKLGLRHYSGASA